MEGRHPKCVQVRTEPEGQHASCASLALSFFMFLSYGVLFYQKKFKHTFIKKGCVCQKYLFFSNEINFCHHEISFFFYFKLFFRTKFSQNAFNFNQIESYVCSIFQCDILLSRNPVQRGTKIYLINYFTSIFTELVLYYCCCCYSYLILLLQQFLN